MKKYVVVGLIKRSCGNQSDNIIKNSIFIILLRNMRIFFIREWIIQNPPFQSSGLLLVILSVSRNMDFGYTS